MNQVIRFGRVDKTGPDFSVQRTIAALKLVAKAAEVDPLELPFNDDGIMVPSVLGSFTVSLREQINQALKNQGSLTVRFLGDLKASIYPIDTHFFRINPTSEGEDDNFATLLKKALLSSDKEEMTFINLANVRDVKIVVGNNRVVGSSADLSYLTTLADTFDAWDKDPCDVMIHKAE
jgi:hypothetical protein